MPMRQVVQAVCGDDGQHCGCCSPANDDNARLQKTRALKIRVPSSLMASAILCLHLSYLLLYIVQLESIPSCNAKAMSSIVGLICTHVQELLTTEGALHTCGMTFVKRATTISM